MLNKSLNPSCRLKGLVNCGHKEVTSSKLGSQRGEGEQRRVKGRKYTKRSKHGNNPDPLPHHHTTTKRDDQISAPHMCSFSN